MMKIVRTATRLLLLACTCVSMRAEAEVPTDSLLTLEGCVSMAMQKNYDVQMASNTLKVAENNVTLAPFLPSLDFTSAQSSSSTSTQKYNSSGVLEGGQSNSTTWRNNLSLNWKLFDGLAMFATRDKQKVLLEQGKFKFRSVVENLVKSISMQYYLIISLQNQVNLLQELVSISQLRYQQALTRYNIGSDSGLEYKQAKIYLNSDSASLLVKKEQLKNAYIELNQLMNVPLDSHYAIQDSIQPVSALNVDKLLAAAYENNTSLLSIKAGEDVALLDTRLAKASWYPSLSASAGYGLNFSSTPYVPRKFDESNGLNAGLTLSIPIFNGFETGRKVRNAELNRQNAELDYQQARQSLESELRQLHNSYLNDFRMIEFQEESREAASLNLEAAMEKYRLGSLAGIEFRDFQVSYLNAADRKLNALYQTKVSEITLRLLAGELYSPVK